MELNRDQIGNILETIFNPSDEKNFYTITPSQTLLLVTIIKELTEENEKLARSCTEFAQNLHECKADTVRMMVEKFKAAQAVIDSVVPVLKNMIDLVAEHYPNKRVLYLALHGKPRVRKKNMKRIMQWIEEGGGNV